MMVNLNNKECFDINNNLGNILYEYNEVDLRDEINLYNIEIAPELNAQFYKWYSNLIFDFDTTTFFFKDVIKKQKRKRIDYLKYVCKEG